MVTDRTKLDQICSSLHESMQCVICRESSDPVTASCSHEDINKIFDISNISVTDDTTRGSSAEVDI